MSPRLPLVLVLAALIGAPAPALSAPKPGVALRTTPKKKRQAKKNQKLRLDILEDVRSSADDPATCFNDDPLLAEPAPLDGPDIEALLRGILDGLEAHDAEQVAAGEAELAAEQAQMTDWFGSADHVHHPSTDLYEDPLAAYSRPDLHLEDIDPADFDYPIVVNERVQNWMVYFLTRGRRWYTKWLARAERYEPLIVPKLEEAGLPKDLLYQSMIESGFNPYAKSHASAVGVWQFISSTGKAYGLHQDWWIDERRDPVEATDAAIAFMSDLYRRFGDWKLASAAYNAGGGKINKAIRMYGTRDYWELSADHRSYLKPETKNYVPKIMAAAILAKYAERYGLADEIPDEHRLERWEHDIVAVPESTDLRVVAEVAGVEVEALEAINPALRRGYTPPGVQNYRLNVPRGTNTDKVAKKLASIPPQERLTFVRHKVRRGDTLGRIARKYGVPVASVQQMNKITDPRKLRVGQSLLVPVRSAKLDGRDVTHVVAKGESLSVIAGKYGTTVASLRSANKLSSDTLKVGQRLTVPGATGGEAVVAVSSKGSSKSSKSTSSAKRTAAPATYTVRKGDSLSVIASRHGMSTTELKKLNKLSSDRIGVGQTLKVRGSAAPAKPRATTTYAVRSGDTLYEIALAHSVSVDELRSWNRLSGNTIRPGQELRVKAPPVDVKHTVARGDTLSGIGKRYGVSVDQIRRWNRLNGDTIQPGQSLKVGTR